MTLTSAEVLAEKEDLGMMVSPLNGRALRMVTGNLARLRVGGAGLVEGKRGIGQTRQSSSHPASLSGRPLEKPWCDHPRMNSGEKR